MYRIVKKEALKPTVTLYEIEAPMVAKKAEPGQFIILRVDENGERIPITIHDFDREKGTVTIIVQTIGATTEKLRHKAEGEYIQDFVGPLGRPTETEGKKKVCSVCDPFQRGSHISGQSGIITEIHLSKSKGGKAVPLHRRKSEQLYRLLNIFFHTLSVTIDFTKCVLGASLSSLRRLWRMRHALVHLLVHK